MCSTTMDQMAALGMCIVISIWRYKHMGCYPTKILDPFSLCPVSSFTLVHWAKHYHHPHQGDGTKLREMDGVIGKNSDYLHTEECMAQLATVYFSALDRLKYEVLCT